MGEIMLLGISSDSLSPMELRTIADWNIRQQLLAVDGIAQVIVLGGAYKQYEVAIDPYKMKYFDVSLAEIEAATALASKNSSGGIIHEYGNQYLIQGLGRTNTVEQLGKTLIKKKGNYSILIEDVAKVQISAAHPIGAGGVAGKESVIITLLKQPNVNTLKLTKRIDESIASIRQQLPESLTNWKMCLSQAAYNWDERKFRQLISKDITISTKPT